MSRELFRLSPQDDVAGAAESILGLGVTAAPVLDEARRPVGVVSLRDLIGSERGGTVAERMSRPAATVGQEATLEQAARKLAECDVHRLVVVDGEGGAVGMVAAVDLVRALVGLPVGHPAALPHLDLATGLTWTDDTLFDLDHVDAAPDRPGLFVLVRGSRDRPEIPVWAEGATNVRTRLSELMSVPQEDPALRQLLEAEHLHLRFRAAAVEDSARRAELLAKLRSTLGQPAPR